MTSTVALFGASGRTGTHVLEEVVAAGHSVRVLVRRPELFGPTPASVTVVPGDVLDPIAVAETVRGADAVISVFGHVKGSPPTLQTDGIRTIVKAMEAAGIRRIVSLSGGGLPAAQDQPRAADHIIRFLLKRLSPQVLEDAQSHLEVLRESGLEWIVVRGPRLTDGPATGTYRVGWWE